MIDLNTYIVEKFKISKDIKTNTDSLSLINFFKGIDNKEKTTKVLEDYFKKYQVDTFDLYFPTQSQLSSFEKDCKNFNISFSDTKFILCNDRQFDYELRSQILDKKLKELSSKGLYEEANKLEEKYLFYKNGEENEELIEIYKGKNPEKGIMFTCYRYFIILWIK